MSKPPFRGTILRNQRRKNIETLIAISSNLDDGDRMIIEQVFRQGRPLTELAVVLNCSNRALQYRLKKMRNYALDKTTTRRGDWHGNCHGSQYGSQRVSTIWSVILG